jgi:hypothetical protein
MKTVAYLGAIEARGIYPVDDIFDAERWHRARRQECVQKALDIGEAELA